MLEGEQYQISTDGVLPAEETVRKFFRRNISVKRAVQNPNAWRSILYWACVGFLGQVCRGEGGGERESIILTLIVFPSAVSARRGRGAISPGSAQDAAIAE